MRVWGVIWWNQDKGDHEIGKVVAADEQEARKVWRSYLNGFGVTEPGSGVSSPYVMWIDPDWDTAIKGGLPEFSRAMQSWSGADFVEISEWSP